MQLAAAVLAHSDSLTNSERTDTLVIFDALLSGLAISKRAAAPKDFPSLLHENVTMVYPSREVTDNHVIPILEVVARIGGAAQVRALRALRDRAAGPCGSEPLREAVETALHRLETRIAEEEAPAMLLRAGHAPSDGLLRGASAPQEVSPDLLLRAGSPEPHD